MKKTLLSLSLAALTMLPANAVQVKERLNRAPVAVSTKTGILVSWRSLTADGAGTSFNVYRGGTKIASGLSTTTNYLDKSGNKSLARKWTIGLTSLCSVAIYGIVWLLHFAGIL